ncbi:Nucleoside triphosphate pyrophosphohydrolase MazG [Paramagnetospirillum magnetotacticum MS-1]|uniref:Nucleoside triphosphate pyrophosphohydrolase n=1 Tax=Paramagnetospirillum magnetotacticum MS-1 TaxID=272627 RepID=A0A0C2YUP8_PARME|nr:nucleoside triphosphate pyrophosphohydrolase [Paramagnetospirillum magnetotacticum]KIL98848.1 Nucleoside triphosphate pyrophosphohydrolase MazG [Paramagnetospirillum magnetotacticum MS-1]
MSDKPIDRLLGIMARLRSPEGGCPWDLEQTFSTIAPYTIEEAYEVAEAIEHGDMPQLKDELGDLLFQVVFYAQMAKENGDFDFDAIASAIADKMIRRHPHVFVENDGRDSAGQVEAWEETKASERAAKAQGAEPGILDGVARTLPPMTRALKLQNRAARVGFDWDRPETILDKLAEEAEEIAEEIRSQAPFDRLEDEMGDVLFVCVNLARKLAIDPERALKRANAKFERRFRHIEAELKASGRSPDTATLDEMEALWQAAKTLEKSGGHGGG